MPRTKNVMNARTKGIILCVITAMKAEKASMKVVVRTFKVPLSTLEIFLKLDKTPEHAVLKAILRRKPFLNQSSKTSWFFTS